MTAVNKANIKDIKDYTEGVSYGVHDMQQSIILEFEYFYPGSTIEAHVQTSDPNTCIIEIDGVNMYLVKLSYNHRAKEFKIDSISEI